MGSADDFLFHIQQQIVADLAADRVLADDLHDQGYGHGRYHIKPPADNVSGDILQRVGQPAGVNQALHRIAPHRLEQDMVRLVPPQHVIDQIGAEQDLPSGLHLPGVTPFDQSGNDRRVAEQPFEQRRVLKPFLELFGHDVRIEKALNLVGRVERPDSQRIVGHRKAEWSQPGSFHPAQHQETQRLVRVASSKAVDDGMVPAAMRKDLDKQCLLVRQRRPVVMQRQPVMNLAGKRTPRVAVADQVANGKGQVRRQWQPPATIARDLRFAALGLGHHHGGVADALEGQDLPA